jgi:superfamily II DNA/RNA helicase
MSFEELGLESKWTAGLVKMGFVEPMPVQICAIPSLLEGVDAYVSAETGTGKTIAYLIPLLQEIDPVLPQTQAVILAPTHELAAQIQQECLKLTQASGVPISSTLLIGGANPARQLEKLKKKPRVVVGSVGRMLELAKMKKLKLQQVKSLVVDEADRLMYGERLRDIEALMGQLPAQCRKIYVSATEQKESFDAAMRLSPNLVRLSEGTNVINRDIEHLYFRTMDREKADLLRRLIRTTNPARAIVFVHRNSDAELVCSKLEHYQISVANLHGAHGKLQRKKALDDFRKGTSQVLVASDIAARGLDVAGVTHIFNYDAPSSSKDYLHRVGRTGRAGQQGYALSLVNEQEERLISRYQRELDITLHDAFVREGEIYSVDAPEA